MRFMTCGIIFSSSRGMNLEMDLTANRHDSRGCHRARCWGGGSVDWAVTTFWIRVPIWTKITSGPRSRQQSWGGECERERSEC